MPFSNPIVAGTALVRSAIKSPNYVAGSTGWSVNADGTAEFASLLIDGGTVIVTFTDGSQVKTFAGSYSTTSGPFLGAWIALEPKNVSGQAWNPGAIGTIPSGTDATRASVALLSPWNANQVGDTQSQILLRNKGDNADGLGCRIGLLGDNVIVGGATTPEVLSTSADTIFMSASNVYLDGNLAPYPGGAHTPKIAGQPLQPASGTVALTWTGPSYVNGFKDGGSPAGYFRDAFGRVSLRGQVTGGAASVVGAVVATLPAGFRPAAGRTEVFAVAGTNAGANVFGRVDVNSAGQIVWQGPAVVTGGVNYFSLATVSFYAEQ